jgi:hypothetical protein
MLNVVELAKRPESITFQRNGRAATARRVELGAVNVSNGQLRIADSAWVDDVPPLPVPVRSGTFPLYAYQWEHRGEAINVCLVLRLARPLFPKARQLVIETDIRPDLTEGVIVDSAEVTIKGDTSACVKSGLGDGYYPVFAVRNLFGGTQAIVVDFKLWHVARYILMPGQAQDEYGFVYFTDRGDSAAT